jgi:polyhydroxyalkanoate synthesis regulator phasin
MSDEKLDLILNVVTDIRTRQDSLEKTDSMFNKEIQLEQKLKAKNIIIDRLETEILFVRKDSIDTRAKIRELETRLSRLENHIGLAV